MFVEKIINFFDRFEDHVRARLSRFPIIYTFIGATAIVLFWRAVWIMADKIEAQGGFFGFLFTAPVNLIIVVLVLLGTGLFVSYFIGDTILISGLKQEKKTTDKTVKEVKEDEQRISHLQQNVDQMKEEVDEIRSYINLRAKEHWENEVKKEADDAA